MIAEIKSKISSTGSNISDRSEDQLTGNVFGTLRYLPFEVGLKHVLMNTKFKAEYINQAFQKQLDKIPKGPWNHACHFWPPHKEGEIDLMLAFESCIIGIEVKFHSGLSSEDAVDNSVEESQELENSKNQLARESIIVAEKCKGSGLERGWLILLAKQGEGEPIMDDTLGRKILQENVDLGVLSWTSVLEALEMIPKESLDSYQIVILEDVIQLLRKKGFDRFRDFTISVNHEVNADDYFTFSTTPVTFSFVSQLTVKQNEYFRFTTD